MATPLPRWDKVPSAVVSAEGGSEWLLAHAARMVAYHTEQINKHKEELAFWEEQRNALGGKASVAGSPLPSASSSASAPGARKAPMYGGIGGPQLNAGAIAGAIKARSSRASDGDIADNPKIVVENADEQKEGTEEGSAQLNHATLQRPTINRHARKTSAPRKFDSSASPTSDDAASAPAVAIASDNAEDASGTAQGEEQASDNGAGEAGPGDQEGEASAAAVSADTSKPKPPVPPSSAKPKPPVPPSGAKPPTNKKQPPPPPPSALKPKPPPGAPLTEAKRDDEHSEDQAGEADRANSPSLLHTSDDQPQPGADAATVHDGPQSTPASGDVGAAPASSSQPTPTATKPPSSKPPPPAVPPPSRGSDSTQAPSAPSHSAGGSIGSNVAEAAPEKKKGPPPLPASALAASHAHSASTDATPGAAASSTPMPHDASSSAAVPADASQPAQTQEPHEHKKIAGLGPKLMFNPADAVKKPAGAKPPPPAAAPPAAAAGSDEPPCAECGCTNFKINPFKKGSCQECFHFHKKK